MIRINHGVFPKLVHVALVFWAVIVIGGCTISSGGTPITGNSSSSGDGGEVPGDTFDAGGGSVPVVPGIGEPGPAADDPNPDLTAPSFDGIKTAVALSPTSVRLSWDAATDNTTPSSEIQYYLFMAKSSGGQNLSNPDFVTSPGTTVLDIVGLATGKVYYFVVRARDATGNVDDNGIEKGVSLVAWDTPTGTDDPVNDIKKPRGDEPSLAFSGNNVYIGWPEGGLSSKTQTYVKAWLGADQYQDVGPGGSLNVDPDRSSEEVTVAFLGNTLYAAWGEFTGTSNDITEGDVYVKRLVGNSWELLGGSLVIEDPGLNHVAEMGHAPNTIPETPHFAFAQEDTSGVYQVFVRRWNETSQQWETLAGPNANGSLNRNPNNSAGLPILAYLGTVPYVTWAEGPEGSSYVSRWTGSAWESVGGKINSRTTRRHAWLTSDGVSVYISWGEEDASKISQAYVAKWSGTAWVKIGSSLNVNTDRDATNTRVSIVGSGPGAYPFAAWTEQNAAKVDQLYAAYWNGSAWIQTGGSLNFDPGRSVLEPQLYIHGLMPYAAWAEADDAATPVYVKTIP
jgi:hypothetical protein